MKKPFTWRTNEERLKKLKIEAIENDSNANEIIDNAVDLMFTLNSPNILVKEFNVNNQYTDYELDILHSFMNFVIYKSSQNNNGYRNGKF